MKLVKRKMHFLKDSFAQGANQNAIPRKGARI